MKNQTRPEGENKVTLQPELNDSGITPYDAAITYLASSLFNLQ